MFYTWQTQIRNRFQAVVPPSVWLCEMIELASLDLSLFFMLQEGKILTIKTTEQTAIVTRFFVLIKASRNSPKTPTMLYCNQ
ncbi:protein of unknown function [Brevefilum fermentans]|uniref:Uncharacterized protein n=1 Tax=Candidatus Brevifilum fermentans TaxID=1986204 RepID=A0A1Y6K2K6_9CHLR|nr:protein of unknown function [Brevefilum fermentans]